MSEIAEALQTLDRIPAADLDEAFSANYPDLKRIAHARITRTGQQGSLQTTALVHDCYVKLTAGGERTFESRLQFLAYASRTVRSIVLDIVRKERAQRRGGDHAVVTLDTASGAEVPENLDIETVNSALDALAKIDPALARLVEMRFFGGLNESELAEALGVSVRTVQREWNMARALLMTLIEP